MPTNIRACFLQVVSIVFAIYALLWGLAPFTEFNIPARFILDFSDWPIDSLSAQLDKNTMWLSSIGAGLLAALSVFLWGIVVPAIKDGNKAIIHTTIVAMLLWYVIDGIGSMAVGISSNVIFNSVYLLLVLVPLVWVRKDVID